MKLPSNIGVEQSVLAGMMNDEECFYEGVSEITTDFFTSAENMNIFNSLKDKQHMPSAKVLSNEFDTPREKSAIRIIDSAWTNYNDFQHSKIELKEIYKKRQLYYSIEKLTNQFDDGVTDELIDNFSKETSNMDIDSNNDEIIDPSDFAVEMLNRFYEVSSDPNKSMGIPYSFSDDRGRVMGLPALDETFNGAQAGDLIMLAAKTGVGKTAFAINLARIFSMYQDFTGYYMNTEMRKEEMNARLLSAIARVSANEIETGRIEGTQSEIEDKNRRILEAHQKLKDSGFIPSVLPHLPLYKAKGLAKQTKIKYGLDYLIVDYVGRMQTNDFQNLWDELYDITKGLKQLAVEMQIPIFMLAQRNQAGDVEGAKKMMNECDGVLFFEPVSEEDLDNINHFVRSDQRSKVNYRIVKQKVRRNDNTHPIYCMFNKSRNEIIEAKREGGM